MPTPEFTRLELEIKAHFESPTRSEIKLSLLSAYLNQIRDTNNVYQYLEAQDIGTWSSQYWLTKAHQMVKQGDYRAVVEAFQVARSRVEVECENQDSVRQHYSRIDHNETSIKLKLLALLRQNSLSPQRKRKVQQFRLLSGMKQDQITLDQLVNCYQDNFQTLKDSIYNNYCRQKADKPVSYLYESAENEAQNLKRIEDKVRRSNSCNSITNIQGLMTPPKKRLSYRLSKTANSVQLAKRKKSTQRKIFDDDDDEDGDDTHSGGRGDCEGDTCSYIQSMPVGNAFTNLKRKRVTFSTEKGCEKVRHQSPKKDKLIADNEHTPNRSSNSKDLKEGIQRSALVKNRRAFKSQSRKENGSSQTNKQSVGKKKELGNLVQEERLGRQQTFAK